VGRIVFYVDPGGTKSSFYIVIVAPFDSPKLLGVGYFLKVATLGTDSEMGDVSLLVRPWSHHVNEASVSTPRTPRDGYVGKTRLETRNEVWIINLVIRQRIEVRI
jgi:hypothetical protein